MVQWFVDFNHSENGPIGLTILAAANEIADEIEKKSSIILT